jgi:hypothetical protein
MADPFRSEATDGNRAFATACRDQVLELGQLIAGPFCTRILGEFGAELRGRWSGTGRAD